MKKEFSEAEVMDKAAAYCAYQERSVFEVKKKLYEWGIQNEKKDTIIDNLIENGFLNEERFARAFVSGKFNLKKWGRIKIRYALYNHQIPASLVDSSLEIIDEEDYLETLNGLFNVRITKYSNRPSQKEKAKVINFLVSRGFEMDLILSLWSESFPNC